MSRSRKQVLAKRAVILLSGGLDSATALYYAKKKGFECFCLIFDYGQRHKREIEAAKRLARVSRCDYKVITVGMPWKGSSLLDRTKKIPDKSVGGIPSTYVPARNSIFLSFGVSFAEAVNAQAICIGAHAQDYSGYPDCRPEFYDAFRNVINVGTKAGVENRAIKIITPLIGKKKSEIIKMGTRLGVPFGLTWSCYRGGKQPCGTCDSCRYRAKGFREAGIVDPALESNER